MFFSVAMVVLSFVVKGMVASDSGVSVLEETLIGMVLCFVGEVLSV